MSNEDRFRVTYYADDGYVGKSRPLHFSIRTDDLEEETSEDQLRGLFSEFLEEAFRDQVHACSDDEDKFVEWAKAKIAAREKS